MCYNKKIGRIVIADTPYSLSLLLSILNGFRLPTKRVQCKHIVRHQKLFL